MRLNHPNCAHRLERDTARQEAAAARTEALQLRGEREVALNRLRAALDASNTQQRESGRQVLAVQLEREIATSRMRADRDAAEGAAVELHDDAEASAPDAPPESGSMGSPGGVGAWAKALFCGAVKGRSGGL